jgi:Protein of unknown function (DUF3180)
MTEPSDQSNRPAPQRPRMAPTRPSTLVVAGLAALAVAWLLISRFYSDFRELPWLPIAVSAALAVLEGFLAYTTRARIERRPGREPVEPLAVARFVVLAKASSLTGALFAGFYAGLLIWLLVEQARSGAADARTSDLPTAAAGVIGALALTAAALWLERACRVPPSDEDKPGGSRSSGAGETGRFPGSDPDLPVG